jgi:glycosidase
VYFVVTDRFVNGDPSNDQRDQGGANAPKTRTFDIPLARHARAKAGNIGYLGGDFKGVLDNAGYIRDLGFTSVWITPIVDNPDEAFTGGDEGEVRRHPHRPRQDRLPRLLGHRTSTSWTSTCPAPAWISPDLPPAMQRAGS